MIELKTCPFCGRIPGLVQWASGGMMYGYRCDNRKCAVNCMGRGRSPMQAAEAWGSRSSSAAGGEIKPCPFCGGRPDAYEWTNKQGEDRFVIECKGCSGRPMLIAETRDHAIDAWNTRAGDES